MQPAGLPPDKPMDGASAGNVLDRRSNAVHWDQRFSSSSKLKMLESMFYDPVSCCLLSLRVTNPVSETAFWPFTGVLSQIRREVMQTFTKPAAAVLMDRRPEGGPLASQPLLRREGGDDLF